MAFLDHNGESEFPMNKGQVFEAMCMAIPTIKGMKIENADKLQGRIMVKAGVSLSSWGENIPIQLIEIGENKTKVQITSSPKTGIMFGGAFDMGKNRKNIEDILSATSSILQQQIEQQSNSQGQLPDYQPQKPQTYQKNTAMTTQSTQQQKKKSSWGKKILIGAGILVAIGVIANLGKDKNPDASTSTNESTSGSGSAESNKPKQWTEIFTLKGNGIKKSANFHLTGGKARMKYTYKTDMGLFSVYVVPEGEDIMKEGGIPEIMIEKSESSETYITKDAGNYYLSVNSSGGDWSIVVEEEQ